MPEDTSNTDGNPPSGETSTAGDDVITMTPKQLSDRLARAKPSDYDDLQAKAARLDELEAANKSEVEKANDKASQAEARAAAAESRLLQLEVAAAKGLHPDLATRLTGGSREELEADADALLALVPERTSTAPRVPREGTNTTSPKPDETREFVRGLFGRGT